jgi:FkbM family methyltransferase
VTVDIKQTEAPSDAPGFTPYVKRKVVEGVEFDFLIGDKDGRSWYDLECTDPDWPEMRFMRDRLVRPGDVVFECGGHHGCTAVVLSQWVGATGKVFTFEPHPRNAEILRQNLALNNIHNATLRQCAVGAAHGSVAMRDVSNSCVEMTNSAPAPGDVDVIKLDDLRNERPTVLKIDVEGFEVEVLKGAAEVLKTRPKLAIEVHTDVLRRYGTSVEELLSYLDTSVYELWVQWDDEAYPVMYDSGMPITSRVHLFAIPHNPV